MALAGRRPRATSVDCARCGARLVRTGDGWVIDVPMEEEPRPEARRIPVADCPGYGLRPRQDGQGVGRSNNPVGFVPPSPEAFRQAAAKASRGRAGRKASRG